MKKSFSVPAACALVTLLAVALAAPPALAQAAAPTTPPARGGSGVTLDGSFYYATEPDDGWDDGYGIELGVNIDADRLGFGAKTSSGTKFQGRASLGYYTFDADGNRGGDYDRIPVTVACRVVSDIAPSVNLYAQLGLELSFDDRGSDDDVHLGIPIGVGLLFPVTPQFYLGGSLNFHLIEDSYWTLGLTAGFNLN